MIREKLYPFAWSLKTADSKVLMKYGKLLVNGKLFPLEELKNQERRKVKRQRSEGEKWKTPQRGMNRKEGKGA